MNATKITTKDVSRKGNAVGISKIGEIVTIEPRPKAKCFSVRHYSDAAYCFLRDSHTFATLAQAVEYANTLGLSQLPW